MNGILIYRYIYIYTKAEPNGNLMGLYNVDSSWDLKPTISIINGWYNGKLMGYQWGVSGILMGY